MTQKIKLADLLKDDSFIRWAKETNQADILKWNSWLEKHPEQIALANEAKLIVLGIPFIEKKVPEADINMNWDRLKSTIETPEVVKPDPKFSIAKPWVSIAASIAFLLLIGWASFSFFQSAQLITINTDFKQTQKIQLPDGSIATLNTNSSLSYYDNWSKETFRKVTLDGEAFFNISKDAKGKKFKVATKDILCEVLGTKFNVNGKRLQSIISLQEGKINLVKAGVEQQLLKPGQTAWFDDRNKKFKIKEEESDYWSAWTKQKWSFGDGILMSEVLERIKETYDLTYEVSDPVIFQKVASGEVDVENKEELLEALAYLLELDIKIKNERLIVSPK